MTYPSYLKKIKTLQNKAMRIISGCDYLDDAIPIYKNLKILQIEDLFRYETAKFVFSCISKQAPKPFSNYFLNINDVAYRTTRHSIDNLNLYIPRYQTNRLQRCIKYQGVKVWNSIPKELKSLEFKAFKTRLKELIISNYNSD